MATETIDYRKVLLAYMKAVARAEGVTFVDHVSRVALTSDEQRALFEVEADLKMDPDMRQHLFTGR